MISIIVAASEKNLVIGKDNAIPWHLPEDLKYFKHVTAGRPVIMGRKCYESIPEQYRPLPGRTNIVMTRNSQYDAPGCEIRRHLKNTVRECQTDRTDYTVHNPNEIFIIGGSQIYKEAFEFADRLYLTIVHKEVEGDTFLEGFDPQDWSMKSAELGEECTFYIYERKREGNNH